MATRFWVKKIPQIPVTPDAGWEQTGQVAYGLLEHFHTKGQTVFISVTVPITTTQDILGAQLMSEPLPAQTIAGTVSFVIGSCNENASTNNATLALVVRVVSRNGATSRG